MTLLADSMLDYKQCLISFRPENKLQKKKDFCGILHKISLMRGDLDDEQSARLICSGRLFQSRLSLAYQWSRPSAGESVMADGCRSACSVMADVVIRLLLVCRGSRVLCLLLFWLNLLKKWSDIELVYGIITLRCADLRSCWPVCVLDIVWSALV